jgi:hypothetical protein
VRTRDVLRWNIEPRGALELAAFVVACTALVLLVDTWGEQLDGREAETPSDLCTLVHGDSGSHCEPALAEGDVGPPGRLARTGAGESRVPRGFGDRDRAGW